MTHSHPTRMKSLTRMFSLVLAAAVAAAVFAPAAFASHKPHQQSPLSVTHRHFLKMYKVEKTFDLEEEQFAVQHDDSTHIYCDENNPNNPNDNDIATDGMWKVVDYEQDLDGSRHYEDAHVFASYADYKPDPGPPAYPNGNPSKWHFEFYNDGIGRAQLKLYVTCLGFRTEPNSHRHTWHWTDPTPQSFTHTDPNAHLDGRRVAEASAVANRCGPGHIAIAPGFQWDRTMNAGQLYASHYLGGQFRRWKWGFWLPPDPYKLDLSLRCLRIDSGPNAGHKHNLVFDFDPAFPMSAISPSSIAADSVETRVRNCDSHEKGMVHSFTLDLHDNMPHHLWYLGMDPRIKSRAYKIQNKDGSAHDAYLGLMCFNDRTGKRIKP